MGRTKLGNIVKISVVSLCNGDVIGSKVQMSSIIFDGKVVNNLVQSQTMISEWGYL